MDDSATNQFDIFDVYRRFYDIRAGTAHYCNTFCNESGKGNFVKLALTQLSKSIDSMLNVRTSIFGHLMKLMSWLNLMGDSAEFSNFYDFVFFICRENGQKRITVSRAVTAWRLVLAGRFRLLNYWCDFVEKNQRHNISEDTWRQVLSFSRCVHEDLEGYDPTGAWPVLIDDFVEHMYRITGSDDCISRGPTCSSGDYEGHPFGHGDSHQGLKQYPGLKRKLYNNDFDFSGSPFKSRKLEEQWANHMESAPSTASNDPPEFAKQNSALSFGGKSSCAVEGYLSKGFADLLSSQPSLQFEQERRTSWHIE